MLSKKKATKRAAISATVRKEKEQHQSKKAAAAGVHAKAGRPASAAASDGVAGNAERHPKTLSRTDALEAGSGSGSRADLIRSIGDHINTRLQDITFEDDLDGDVFHERRAQLMEEARLAAGVKQRVVSTAVRDYLGHATELRDVHTVRIAHNCNSITCVAALGTDRIVYGDKSGKVYLVDISLTTSGTGVAVSDRAEAERRRKVLLEPVLPSGIVSIAVSDTSANRPTTRDVFEKTTVDMSCPSYVAAGAMDGSISIWETLTKVHKGLLFMHRKPITGLRFRMDTSTLYSCCEDGTLRVWSVPQMMAVDKLFGHEGPVHCLDGLRKETAATVGEDATMRFWKVDAATQQAYTYAPPRALESSPSAATGAAPPPPVPNVVMEAVAMLNEGIVIGGTRDGSIVVFDLNRRKPLIVVPNAHGSGFIGDGTGLEKAAALLADEDESARRARGYPASASPSLSAADSASSSSPSPLRGTRNGGGQRQNPNPITAVAAVPYADVIATASYDGVVRVWHVAGVGAGAIAPGRRTEDADGPDASPAKRVEPQLVLVAALPVPAIVNSLRFSDSGEVLYIAMAKEPRRGRWVVQSSARNGVLVVPLTEGGKRRLAGMRGEVEHIPAQLFGIDDNAVEDGASSQDEEEAVRVGSSAELPTLDALDDENDADMDDAAAMEVSGNEGDEEEDDMFRVGADGMLHFKESSKLATKLAPKVKKSSGKAKKSGMPKVLRTASAAAVGESPAAAKAVNGKTAASPTKKTKKAVKKATASTKMKITKKLKKA